MTMPRQPGRITPDERMWFAEGAAAPQRMHHAEHECDDPVRQSLADGLGVRGAARALKIDKVTVSRRYKRCAE
jgi:transposase-like protein